MNKNELIEALLTASDVQARLFLLKGNPDIAHIDIVYALKEQADKLERDDARRALEIGQIAGEAAEYIDDNEARALALWAQANAHDSLADLESAVQYYERAAELFKSAGKNLDAARISIGHMFTLMKLGQFDRALLLAESARIVFIEQQDTLYLAKLDMNLGNIHYSQGQYALAVESFERATTAFTSLGENFYGAMSKINWANSLLPLDGFLLAEQLHEQAKPIFEESGLRTAAASVDYDLAMLQYARGNYAEAFRTFERARFAFSSLDLRANLAMTDNEESGLYLDLNLPDETLRLSRRAEQAFAEMGMTYELASSKANQALALARLGHREKAAELLVDARGLFLSLANDDYVTRTDLQRAEVLGLDGQHNLARQLIAKAVQAYEKLGMKTRQAYAHILAANSWADDCQWLKSFQELQSAKQALGNLSAPWLNQRIDTCLGRVHEGMGEIDQAVQDYKKAVGGIEQITATLTADEHRTAFVTDKLAPYEALVTINAFTNPSLAFSWAEQGKSRALVNLLSAGVRPRFRIADEMDARQAERLQDIRDELNWLYTRLTRGVAPGETGVPAASPETWKKIKAREQEATSIWRSLRGKHAEELSLIREASLTPSDIQANLPDGTVLVEYFIARGQIIVFLITPSEVRSYPSIASTTDVLNLMEKLAFQFSKFQYGTGYYQRHKTILLQSTQEILAELGQKLIGPFWNELSKSSAAIVIPHGPLHSLPFQSLRMDGHYFIETHAISYAPSASVLKFCWKKSTPFTKQHPYSGKPLLVGVPDESISHVMTEINTIANIFGESDILLGEDATFENVSRGMPTCGVLHLAAHGLFRPEAPLLSSIRLADRWLAVQDIYNLDLKTTLVILSACETGLGHDAGGDDLVGLVRGFLYAGAASLIVSLWTVDDESMTQLVTDFYSHWLAGNSKVEALREAQLSLLKEYEHPYYWSPLMLVGSEK
jgi:tetratricopeptide (TPR) repeat protein